MMPDDELNEIRKDVIVDRYLEINQELNRLYNDMFIDSMSDMAAYQLMESLDEKST
jgi:hypothetical protein